MITQPIGYVVVVEKSTGLIFRVSQQTKDAWDVVTEGRKISQQEAGRALVEWFVSQNDEVLQAMILGQIPASPDLVKLVLQRIAEPKPSTGRPAMKAARNDGKK